MKKLFFVAAAALIPLALVGSPSGLTWTCVDGTLDSGACTPGRVAFTGAGYPAVVHVNVTNNSNGAVYDDFDYDNSAGTLSFTETLLSGTYSVTITGSGTYTSQTVTSGSSGQ